MNILQNLEPGRGFGNLVFGMNETMVMEKMGIPDFQEVFEDAAFGSTKVFYYFDQGVSLYFDEEDEFRLGCLEVDSMEFFLWNQKIARISKKKLKQILGEKGILDIEEESDEDQDAFIIDSLSASFYFEFDTLISVQLGVFTDDMERPVWPDRNI